MVPVKRDAKKDEIILAVARELGVTYEDIVCSNREAWRVLTRYTIAYILRDKYHWPWDDVKAAIGKERTTAYYAVDVARMMKERATETEKDLMQKVEYAIDKHFTFLSTN